MGHHRNKAAFALLPRWQQEKWKSARQAMSGEYCGIPDFYYTNQRKYEKYCKLPNGKLIPHALTNKAFNNFPSFSRDVPDYDNNLYVISYYLQKIVGLMHQGEYHESAVFAATFAHYLQDAVCPGHAMENSLFPALLPFPKGKYWHLHRVIESTYLKQEDLISVKPVLLGATVREAAYNLLNKLLNDVNISLGLIIPHIQAIYQGNVKKHDKIIMQWSRLSVSLAVSAYYTAFCIAAKRFSADELDQLKLINLSDIPYFNRFTVWQKFGEPLDLMSHDPYMFEPLRDHALKRNDNASQVMKTVPLSVFIKQGRRLVKQTFARGFGAAGRSRITLRIDGHIHAGLQTTFGIHSMIKSTKKEVFKILIGSDVNHMKEVFTSGPVACGAPARTIQLSFNRQAKYLRLATEGKLKDYLQIVWADPVLIRR